jgi:hypothetical protein
MQNLSSSFRTPRSGDPGPSDFALDSKKSLGKLAASMRLALRAIGYADVRSGILPSQSGSAREARATPE